MSGKRDPRAVALQRGVNLILPVVRAIERGRTGEPGETWKPTPAAEILLSVLRAALRTPPR